MLTFLFYQREITFIRHGGIHAILLCFLFVLLLFVNLKQTCIHSVHKFQMKIIFFFLKVQSCQQIYNNLLRESIAFLSLLSCTPELCPFRNTTIILTGLNLFINIIHSEYRVELYVTIVSHVSSCLKSAMSEYHRIHLLLFLMETFPLIF